MVMFAGNTYLKLIQCSIRVYYGAGFIGLSSYADYASVPLLSTSEPQSTVGSSGLIIWAPHAESYTGRLKKVGHGTAQSGEIGMTSVIRPCHLNSKCKFQIPIYSDVSTKRLQIRNKVTWRDQLHCSVRVASTYVNTKTVAFWRRRRARVWNIKVKEWGQLYSSTAQANPAKWKHTAVLRPHLQKKQT